ncbi:ATP-grasp domain-containing protein [Actinokineospora fastidiosa]|uniref:Carbamoyl-phosphate-synthetase n=1 Tax=Actinokineospora fastidiosa TaxID=1816 RepID=A0A918GM60_9PSEU|nr:ATP-grasp domain-containing protein [Actinokineospora fastidiosa]GGS46273.1 carbamoyl-phosphate-synthetase [Actinokineospora fastidiosa]
MSAGELLVLGAGEEQVVLYQEACRRGLRTIAVDMRADRPGIPLADEFLKISTMDHAAIADALRGRRLAGVVSTAADTCLESWHHLSVHFGTPWVYPAEAAAASMDKSAFHRIAGAAGVPTYRWAQSDDLVELADAARGFRFPVVVKPTDASGGRGVTGVPDPGELDAALKHAAVHSPRGQVIVEEFVEGVNYTVNVFMSGGEVALSVITEKAILPGPGFLIGGHTAPARLSPSVEAAMTREARDLCRAFALHDGPANFDVVVRPDGTRYTLEVGARMSGNGFPRLVSALAGVDCVAALVSLATGEPVDLTPTHLRPTRLHVLTSPLPDAGEFVAARGLAEVAAMPDVTSVELFVAPGDIVQPFTEAGRKLGWVVVTADDAEDLEPRVSEVVAALDLAVRPLGVREGQVAANTR